MSRLGREEIQGNRDLVEQQRLAIIAVGRQAEHRLSLLRKVFSELTSHFVEGRVVMRGHLSLSLSVGLFEGKERAIPLTQFSN
ncbi:MAG TPA: hypothetical protein VFI43_03955 [Nitrosospira sp.]|nr:hypothetical protein [Nitrosospira sp.]